MQVTAIGLDLAKRVFQVHGVDADGRVVVQRRLQRGEVAAFFCRSSTLSSSALRHARRRTTGRV